MENLTTILAVNSTKTTDLNNNNYNPFRFIGPLACVLYVISYSTDVLAIVTIHKCRSQLKLVEMFILRTGQMLSVSYKFVSFIIVLAIYFDKFILGNQTCVRFYPFTFSFSLFYNLTWLYYSLYHYSSIKRSGHYLIMFNFTHNPRNYCLLIGCVFSSIFALVCTMFNVYRGEMLNETNDGKCGLMYKNVKTLMLLGCTAVPSLMVLAVYLVSIVNLSLKVRSKLVHSKIEMNSYRKSFRVTLKFLCFSMLPFSSCCIRFGFVSLAFLCPTCKKYYFDLLQFALILSYMVEPGLIIYVHNVLNRQFSDLLRSFSSFILYSDKS